MREEIERLDLEPIKERVKLWCSEHGSFLVFKAYGNTPFLVDDDGGNLFSFLERAPNEMLRLIAEVERLRETLAIYEPETTETETTGKGKGND